ncbi:hypothetical protein BDP27DRAFT_1421364 [Rhodocollybia butyracea]|uniref:Uncharacterized protein n=1 Tax=Rhodocollybia butyracea TaxID=206335 RepID=A0A9P5PT53_9AGAR|nr:hypothetical protein BDP27DRAFT_1421364 [Rhodocollybia butyracea]
MSTNRISPDAGARRSSPIPIANSSMNRSRGRSASVSSGSSASMSPSSSELPTPVSGISPRITVPSPGSSPILSYFLAQSPTKSQSATLPFRKFGPAPVFEGLLSLNVISYLILNVVVVVVEDETVHSPAMDHARRTSLSVADRFNQPNNNAALPESHVERGTGLLRRLSLSTGASAFTKASIHILQVPPPFSPTQSQTPGAPPNSAVSPTAPSFPYPRDPRRRSTTSAAARPPRAPSPMGERILKGHFDGFN